MDDRAENEKKRELEYVLLANHRLSSLTGSVLVTLRSMAVQRAREITGYSIIGDAIRSVSFCKKERCFYFKCISK